MTSFIIKMEESFKKEISGYGCYFLLESQTLQITCLSLCQSYELCGSFSRDNIPENIKITLGQCAEQVYRSIQGSRLIVIEESQLCVGYQIGIRTIFFKMPLVKKDLDQKDIAIAGLKKESNRKQIELVKKEKELAELRNLLEKTDYQIQEYKEELWGTRQKLQRKTEELEIKEKELFQEKKQKQEKGQLKKQNVELRQKLTDTEGFKKKIEDSQRQKKKICLENQQTKIININLNNQLEQMKKKVKICDNQEDQLKKQNAELKQKLRDKDEDYQKNMISERRQNDERLQREVNKRQRIIEQLKKRLDLLQSLNIKEPIKKSVSQSGYDKVVEKLSAIENKEEITELNITNTVNQIKSSTNVNKR